MDLGGDSSPGFDNPGRRSKYDIAFNEYGDELSVPQNSPPKPNSNGTPNSKQQVRRSPRKHTPSKNSPSRSKSPIAKKAALTKTKNFKIEDQRIFIQTGQWSDCEPISFNLRQNEDTTLNILYKPQTDQFFQLKLSQSSLNSCFLDSQNQSGSVIDQANIYMVTPFSTVYFLLNLFANQQQAMQNKGYQPFEQILESLCGDSENLMTELNKSKKLKEGLGQVCDVKEIEIIKGQKQQTYCYSTEKVFSVLNKKHKELMKFLGDRYHKQKAILAQNYQMVKIIKPKNQQNQEVPEEESKTTKNQDEQQEDLQASLFTRDAFDMLCDELPNEIIKMFEKKLNISRDESQNLQQKQRSLEESYQVMAAAHQAASAKPQMKSGAAAMQKSTGKQPKIDAKQPTLFAFAKKK